MKPHVTLFRLALVTSAVACALALPPPRRSAAWQDEGRAVPASPAETVTTPSGIELVHVPPGHFLMGTEKRPAWVPDRNPDELPVHKVTIRRGFYLGKYEVTQAQWRAVMGADVARQRDKANPSWKTVGEGDDYPVYYVNWDEAQEFIHRLNRRGDGFAYRLPSEAEWEYACRAGSTDSFASQPGPLDAMAWWFDNSGGRTHPVGQKLPNAFGLYDMHGNVWEWCRDSYHKNYVGAPKDAAPWLGAGESNYKVLRGGSWDYPSYELRSANRGSHLPSTRGNHIGFRVAADARP